MKILRNGKSIEKVEPPAETDALSQLDAIVHALEIEDSFKTPVEVINEMVEYADIQRAAIAVRDVTIARLSADLAAVREALTETEDFITDHVSDMEDGQRPHEREYLALAIEYRDKARAVLAKLSAKGE